ncbi:MAG: NB-ARC domain-containing protein, partial [Chloroflexota bacterium]
MQSFGEYLTYLMKKKEIGPSTLARKANIPLQTINSWRAEHVKRPRNLEQILSAAHVLQLNISEVEGLLGAAGQPSLSLLQKHPQTELVSSLLMTWRKNPVSSHEIPPTDLSLWKLMPFGQDARIPDVSTLPAGSNMPFAKNSIFVGRSNQLREISKELKDGGKSIGQIVAITGTGGLGKSQLATEFVHRYGRFFDGGVYWINCANSANIDQEIAQCALKMGKPEIGIPELSKWAQTEWLKPVPRLLIFDNCEENELLQKYRPITGGCRILITCRRQEWWPTLGVKTIQLDTLSKESSIKLLQNIAPRISVNEAHELSAAVEYFPLALHVIGSYLRINKIISANKFLKRLSQANRLEHPALRGEDSASSPTNHDHHLARTFQFSWEQFEANNQIDQAARQILFFASFLAPNTFLPTVILWHLLRKQFLTESSLDDQGQEHIFSQSLDKALNIGLVRQMEGGMVLHGLVKNFIQSQLQAHQFNIYQETINQVFIDEF